MLHHHFPLYVSLNTSVCALPRVINRACLTNDTHFDLTRIVQALLNFVRDIAGQACSRVLVDLLGLDDNTRLAASLDGEGFLHASKRIRDMLQRLQALDIEIDRL